MCPFNSDEALDFARLMVVFNDPDRFDTAFYFLVEFFQQDCIDVNATRD